MAAPCAQAGGESPNGAIPLSGRIDFRGVFLRLAAGTSEAGRGKGEPRLFARHKPKQSTDTSSLPQSRFLPVTIGSPPAYQIEFVLPGRATIRLPVQELAALRVLLEWLGQTPVVQAESLEC